MTDGRVEVLLTGASGFLGHYLLAELLAYPNVRCHVLLRSPMSASAVRLDGLLADIGLNLSALIAEKRIVPVEGGLPDSLSGVDFSGIDVVLHAAGNTTFHANGSGEPMKTNVDGTRAMLTLAADAGVDRFVYVSTAYVCGEQVGHLPEAFYPTLPPVRNDYEHSKWEAERLVWEWGGQQGVATICRPSILFGDSRTGRASAMKGLYLVAKATEILARAMDSGRETDRHQIPLRILGRSDATCNVVPIDWAARQIAGIAMKPAIESSVYHVTNPDPPTHDEIKCWLEEYFDIAGGRFSGAKWPLQDANHYEDLFYSLGNICLEYFRHGLTHESRCAASVLGGHRLLDREAFFRCMKYAQATNWCRSRSEAEVFPAPIRNVDSKWYFESFLPESVPLSVVAKVNELTAIVRYTITGSDGGSWVSRFDRGRLVETQSTPATLEPEFEYRLSCEDLADVVTCHRPLQDVFFHGSAEMFGDVERALKMVPIIGEFIKEFPVVDRECPVPVC